VSVQYVKYFLYRIGEEEPPILFQQFTVQSTSRTTQVLARAREVIIMVNIYNLSDQNKDSAAKVVIYDISLISDKEKQRILEIENSKLVKCFRKNSNLSLSAKFEIFDMLLHRSNLI
jgi:hypothetical protein